MIKDKTLDILLVILFGLGGIAILIMAWAQPMTPTERTLTISIGSMGLFGMLIRMLIHKHLPANNHTEPLPVEARSEETQ